MRLCVCVCVYACEYVCEWVSLAFRWALAFWSFSIVLHIISFFLLIISIIFVRNGKKLQAIKVEKNFTNYISIEHEERGGKKVMETGAWRKTAEMVAVSRLFTKVFILESLAVVADQLAAPAIIEPTSALLHLLDHLCGVATPTAQGPTIVRMQALAILGDRAVGGRGLQIVQCRVLRLLGLQMDIFEVI